MIETNKQIETNKHKFAEVFTPPSLVNEILSLLDFKDKKIYEPGFGQGAFYKGITDKGITDKGITDKGITDKGITDKGITTTDKGIHYESYEGCEINPTIEMPPGIIVGDFFDQELKEYDLILGNPPFHKDGFKGPPCAKTRKGTTIWPQIVRKCFDHLVPGGIIAMVLPCIWLKPDKEKIYDLFTSHQILYLRVYTSVESNKLFKYHAQTPCCYVIVEKTPTYKPMLLWDNEWVPFSLKPGWCIPTQNASLINSFQPRMKINPIKIAYIKDIDPVIVKEPNDSNDSKHPNNQKYPIITTYKETIYGFESDEPGKYQGVPKIIMAHKTFPIPFLDHTGKYGVYGRDKFVFLDNLLEQYEYLSDPIVQKIIKSFTIRMNFIEKDIFKYISL